MKTHLFRSAVLNIIRRQRVGISAAAIAARLGSAPHEIRGDLIALARAGKIRSVGNTRAAVWVKA